MRFSKFKSSLMAVVIGMVMMVTMLISPLASADTLNFPSTRDVNLMTFHVSGQYTATTAGVAKFKLPFAAKLINATAYARASGGTTPTLTIDVKNGASSVLNAPFSLTAGTVGEATTVTSPNFADESVVSIDLNIGGTSPTWNDITVILMLVRR